MSIALEPHDASMKTVYTLSESIRQNPSHAETVRQLTLNVRKPDWGLSGKHGLFGDPTWWDSIRSGRMKLLTISGVIEETYVAGQDNDEINTATILAPDGTRRDVGIYLNDRADLKYFRVGHKASIVYALDELKQPAPDGSADLLPIAIEMAVSTVPVG